MIDLGEISSDPDQCAGRWDLLAQRRRRALWRSLSAALLALAVLVLATASVPRRAWWPGEPLWKLSLARLGPSWDVIGGMVFTEEPSGSGQAYAARDARTGNVLWQSESTNVQQWITSLGFGVVALTSDERVSFVSPRTAGLLGVVDRAHVYYVARVAGAPDLVLLESGVSPDTGGCPEPDQGCIELAAVSIAADGDGSGPRGSFGEPVWRIVISKSEIWKSFSRDGVGAVALALPGQPVEFIDPISGSTIARQVIPAGTEVRLLTSDHLVTLTVDEGQVVVAGHAFSPAVSDWRAVFATPNATPASGGSAFGVQKCGDLICVYDGAESAEVRTVVLEPTTGRLVATLPGAFHGQELGDRLYLTSTTTYLDLSGYLDRSGEVTFSLFDADGTLVSTLPAGLSLVSGEQVYGQLAPPDPGDPVLLARPGRTGMDVYRVRANGEVPRLGTIYYSHCQPGGSCVNVGQYVRTGDNSCRETGGVLICRQFPELCAYALPSSSEPGFPREQGPGDARS